MKKLSGIILIAIIGIALIFSSCQKDTQAPKIYLLDAQGKIMPVGKVDTTVLLYTIYVDPGIRVEDNATKTSDIVVTSDIESVLKVNSEGYLNRTGEYEITYTATDLDGNVATKKRLIKVVNISEPFIGSYIIRRDSQIANDTTYKSTIVADQRVPGRLRFSKVYAHTWDGRKIYYRVNADLWNPGQPTNADPNIGYMGSANNPSVPFFRNMTYVEGFDSILTFRHLRIPAQNYLDTTGNEDYKVYIAGVEDTNGVPLSRIEYIGNSKTIARIVLELNVTKNNVVDRVTETYIME